MRVVWTRVRRAFLAGLLVGVPLGVSIWVVYLLVAFLESAILLVPDALQPEALIGRKIPGLGMLLALTTIFLLGLGAESYLGRITIRLYEALLARVPGISGVYSGMKQLMQQLTQSDKKGFERVVLVQWPRIGTYSVAFETGNSFAQGSDERMVSLFLPTTPNPTTGFFIMVPEKDVVHTQLTMEDAFKLIMSAGIVAPGNTLTLPAERSSSFKLMKEFRTDLGDPEDTE